MVHLQLCVEVFSRSFQDLSCSMVVVVVVHGTVFIERLGNLEILTGGLSSCVSCLSAPAGVEVRLLDPVCDLKLIRHPQVFP